MQHLEQLNGKSFEFEGKSLTFIHDVAPLSVGYLKADKRWLASVQKIDATGLHWATDFLGKYITGCIDAKHLNWQ